MGNVDNDDAAWPDISFRSFFALYALCDLKRRRLGEFVSYMRANIDGIFSYLVMIVQ